MNFHTFNPHFAPQRAMARPYTLDNPNGIQSKPIICCVDLFA
jgi:hypothetical protein